MMALPLPQEYVDALLSLDVDIVALTRDCMEERDLDRRVAGARALREVARDFSDCRAAIAAAGAAKALLLVLREGNPGLAYEALQALVNLTCDTPENRNLIPSLFEDGLPLVVQELSSRAPDVRHAAAELILSLSAETGNTTLLSGAGAIPPLVQLLALPYKSGAPDPEGAGDIIPLRPEQARQEGADLERFAARESAEKTSGESDKSSHREANGLVRDTQLVACRALYNLAVAMSCRAEMVKAGAVKPLVDMIREDDRSPRAEKAVRVLKIISSISEGRNAITMEPDSLEALVGALQCESEVVQNAVVTILLEICRNSKDHLSLVALEAPVSMVWQLTQSSSKRIKDKAAELYKLL